METRAPAIRLDRTVFYAAAESLGSKSNCLLRSGEIEGVKARANLRALFASVHHVVAGTVL
jgi:hypothetical protein